MANTKWGNNKDANYQQLLNHVLQFIAGNHGSPVEGLIHYDSTGKHVKVHNGTALKTIPFSDETDDADTLETHAGSYYLSRANHSGTQTASTISDFTSAVNALLTSYATDADVTAAIDALVASAPGTLNTLDELAAALGDDANFASTVTTALNARMRRYAANIGDGSTTAYTVTHNLNTLDVIVQVYKNSTGAQIEPDVDRTTVNAVVITYSAGAVPATNADRVVVMG